MVDVCLVVEGSYPYVTGGVSSWTHALLEGLPDVRFTVAHVRDADDPAMPHAYAMPAGVELVHVDMDPDDGRVPAGAHLALPEARVYHAACTGAAGEVARLAAAEHGGAFALTEHGIAWREARWGITGCKHRAPDLPPIVGCKHRRPELPPIVGCKHRRPELPPIVGCKHRRPELVPLVGCKHRWEEPQRWSHAEALRRADQVLAMALRAYAEADVVTSVCGPNAAAQRALGAQRPLVIPNATAWAGKSACEGRFPAQGLLFGFVGRVAAVKDVETLLRAWALVARARPDADFVVVGPTHHEPEYAHDMRALAGELGLPVTFTGEADPAPWYARMDALVLTSLSEAQPLVALEAMAAGVPVVATDVGGCREAIGPAGLLTAARDPQATARALLALAGDPALRERLGTAGMARVAARHAAPRIHAAYGELYERLAA